MYVELKKTKEDTIFVSYSFETYVYVESKDKAETKYGLCKFNKLTEEFQLDEKQTDYYFIEGIGRETLFIKYRLIKIKREGGIFLDIMSIATG